LVTVARQEIGISITNTLFSALADDLKDMLDRIEAGENASIRLLGRRISIMFDRLSNIELRCRYY
jgi:hypothetical protein